MGEISGPVCVAVVGDAGWELPLAVTIDGLLRRVDPSADVQLHVLSQGCDEALVRRVVAGRAEVVWQELSGRLDGLRDLPRVRHIPPISFVRVLLPELLPGLDRVLYVDTDLVIKADVAELWRAGTGGMALAAVRDPGIDRLGASNCLGYAAEELEDPDAPAFNGGVLLMDLEQWRRDGLGGAVLAFAERHAERLNWADQDGLNAVLAGRWSEREQKWNVPVVVGYGGEPRRVASLERFDTDPPFSEPAIYHLFGAHKPWNSGPRHTFREAWLTELRASGAILEGQWADWLRRDQRRAAWFSVRRRLVWPWTWARSVA
ncbi:MAG: glycosyltransferase [Planctomycetota bacterium]